MRRELQLAADVQRSMLPNTLPVVPGYSIWAWWQPAFEVGGDLYDIHVLTTGEILIVLADVAGKGLAAAMGMASLAATIPLLLQHAKADLTAFVGALNKSVARWATPVDRFVSLMAVLLDPVRHELNVVNAASSGPALIRRQNGSIENLADDQHADFPLGVLDAIQYRVVQVAVEPGDFVLITTDGITNSANVAGEEYGTMRLLDALARASPPAGKLGEAVLESIGAFVGIPRVQDDATMVCFGRD